MKDDVIFFDRIAPKWDSMEVLSLPDKVRHILGVIGIAEGDRVLDLGTGTGLLIPYICGMIGPQGSVTGVDFSQGMLDRAVAKCGGLTPAPRFLKSDFEEENVEGCYNHILLYCVYPHLHRAEATLHRLYLENLLPGGRITVAFPTDEHFINNIHHRRNVESEKLPPAGELSRRFRDMGFESEVLEATPDSYIVSISKPK